MKRALSLFLIFLLTASFFVVLYEVPKATATTNTVYTVTTTTRASYGDMKDKWVFRANGSDFVFYRNDNNYLSYRSSIDNGATWGDEKPTQEQSGSPVLAFCNGDYIGWWVGVSTTQYYRLGRANSDGSISWLADKQSFTLSNAIQTHFFIDSGGYMWYTYKNSGSNIQYALKSSVRNGSFINAWAAQAISGSYSSSDMAFTEKANGDIVFFSNDNINVKYRVYFGSNDSFSAAVSITGGTDCAYAYAGMLTCSSYQNTVYFAYVNETGAAYNNYYIKCGSLNSTWHQSPLTVRSIDLGRSNSNIGLVCAQDGGVFLFFSNKPSKFFGYYKFMSNVWDTNYTIIYTETEDFPSFRYVSVAPYVVDGYASISWESKTSSRYNIKFMYIQAMSTLILSTDAGKTESSKENGTDTTLSVNWTTYDYTGGSMLLSGFIIETQYGTGNKINSTWAAFGASNSSVASHIIHLGAALGTVVSWLCYANSTTNQWGASATFTFIIQGTVTYIWTTGGAIWKNRIAINNMTAVTYTTPTTLELTAITDATNSFQNFSHTFDGVNYVSTNNPFNYSIQGLTTIKCFFDLDFSAGYSVGWLAGNLSGFNTGYSYGWVIGNASGYSAGYASGLINGNATGYLLGWGVGNASGYVSGYAYGWTTGNDTGYINGYNYGWYIGNLTGSQNGGGGIGDAEAIAAGINGGVIVGIVLLIVGVMFGLLMVARKKTGGNNAR